MPHLFSALFAACYSFKSDVSASGQMIFLLKNQLKNAKSILSQFWIMWKKWTKKLCIEGDREHNTGLMFSLTLMLLRFYQIHAAFHSACKKMHFAIAWKKKLFHNCTHQNAFVIECIITHFIIGSNKMQFSVAFIKMHTNIIDFCPSVH